MDNYNCSMFRICTVETQELELSRETKNSSSYRGIRVIGVNFSEVLIKGNEI